MILIFGGTTEGRTAAETLDEAGQPFYYSTRGTLQEVTCQKYDATDRQHGFRKNHFFLP